VLPRSVGKPIFGPRDRLLKDIQSSINVRRDSATKCGTMPLKKGGFEIGIIGIFTDLIRIAVYTQLINVVVY
jgi:hypothetical protein